MSLGHTSKPTPKLKDEFMFVVRSLAYGVCLIALFQNHAKAVDCVKPEKCTPTCKTISPSCGPVVRVVVPPAEVVFRQYCPKPVETIAHGKSSCTSPSCLGTSFGAAPTQSSVPAMTTVHVPYTYYVTVPTYGVVPYSMGFGAVPAMGLGASFPSGGVFPTGGFGSANMQNEAFIKAFLNKPTKGENQFGSAPDANNDCNKEIAALNAKIEAMRGELSEFYKHHKENDAKVKEAIVKLSEKLMIVNDKLGTTKDGKTLAASIAELDERITRIKKQINLND